ncbi:TIGR04222 domain-containing membrane protein [Streptomyces sp. NPDC090025]|uniref:TIGR04222 domain-containing membrane protein n=1 Tax=Streptomyces sp. NPDC090025 TaxID=3365922 RepID=UPI0038379262
MAVRTTLPYNRVMVWVPLLLVAFVVSGIACARACRDAVAADRPTDRPTDRPDARPGAGGPGGLTVREAAYLAGGPLRVVDLTLVALHRARLLLLAQSGWATVVDGTGGRDELERSVLGACGPGGQSPVPAVRPRAADAACVRELAADLVARGLARAEQDRRATAAGTGRWAARSCWPWRSPGRPRRWSRRPSGGRCWRGSRCRCSAPGSVC